ncbi:MAG: ABC transporter substrate-binding protein [Tannerellaceae bacterium]|jgi:ABC-type nitrate/sulfonate/bicarbonate transport system substrate-binding protein|nr:ABC transporter substrate-binding protein [Tannerellaceae bacterium]
MRKTFQYAVFIALGGSILFACKGKKENELTLADASVVWWMAPGSIAQQDSIYEKNGLNVTAFSLQTGLQSKNAVISGAADIGLTATTPLAMGAFNKENLIVLCSYMESNSLLSLLTSAQTNSSQFPEPERPVAIIRGTISELYFYNYLRTYYPNVRIDDAKQLSITQPADALNVMRGDNAKSVVIWEPFATILSEKMPNLKVCRAEDVYTHRMYIVTTPEVLDKKRVAVQKFLKSFEQACELLNTNPAKGKAILKAIFPQQESSMNMLWDKVNFSLQFDYDAMKELILKDAQTAFELGQTPKDKLGQLRQLKEEDLQHYFNYDFKPN